MATSWANVADKFMYVHCYDCIFKKSFANRNTVITGLSETMKGDTSICYSGNSHIRSESCRGGASLSTVGQDTWNTTCLYGLTMVDKAYGTKDVSAW